MFNLEIKKAEIIIPAYISFVKKLFYNDNFQY